MKRLWCALAVGLGAIAGCDNEGGAKDKAAAQRRAAEGPAGPLTTAQTQRKAASEARLAREGVPVAASLPAIEDETRISLRSPQEVARRVMVLSILAARAEPDGMPQEMARKLLGDRGLLDSLTPKEQAFLAKARPSEKERALFTWRYEAAWVLLWALGHADTLGPPTDLVEASAVARIVAEADPKQFVEGAKLRPASEILDQADLIYRYDWAAVDARVKGKPAPAGLDPQVIYERHYALNWLIGYAGQEWDEVTTDT